MAASVALLGAGVLSFAPPATGDAQTPSAGAIGGDPRLTAAPPAASPTPDAVGSSTPAPTATRGNPPRAFATRIRIPSLAIDLPIVPGDHVVPGNLDLYPLCDVAMFMVEFVQPGEPGATYVYAHAQRGMFAPLLRVSEIDDGAAMVGALVEVYTSNDELHVYEITRIKRHATDLSLARPAPGEHMLVLQTSEGPSGTIPKLQVAARPLSVVPAPHDEANPSPSPRVCLPS